MPLPTVMLKPERERSVKNRHPWIFSGAVADYGDAADGELARVVSADGETLGSGYVNRTASIAVRLLAFGKADPREALAAHVAAALALRKALFSGRDTNCYRIINGEGDGVPGLVADLYGDVAVLQSGTLGVDKLKTRVAELLREHLPLRSIYEKSHAPSRAEEKLAPSEGVVWGEPPGEIEVRENGIKFSVAVADAQKTGLFLDQREMRALVREMARGRTVLNCFSYTGSFSLAAALGGALRADSLDSSAKALEGAKRNFSLNGLDAAAHGFIEADALQALRSISGYDFVVLDPPAFAKKKSHLEQAAQAYREINRLTMKALPPGGLLLSCSCSYYMDEAAFQGVLFKAARDVGREAKILQYHRLASDHPVSIFHPEGRYLKSVLMEIG